MHFKCLNWITAAALIWYLTLQRVHNVQITCHYYFHFDDSICWVCVFIYRWSIKCGIYTIALPFNNECNQSAASWVGSIEAIWQAPYRKVNILTMWVKIKPQNSWNHASVINRWSHVCITFKDKLTISICEGMCDNGTMKPSLQYHPTNLYTNDNCNRYYYNAIRYNWSLYWYESPFFPYRNRKMR